MEEEKKSNEEMEDTDEEMEDTDNEKAEEEMEEMAEKQEMEIEKIRKSGGLISPEGILMLVAAVFIDVGEFAIEFLPVIGQIISFCIDIFALIFIGGWMWFRSGAIKVTKKAGGRLSKLTKWSKRLKWLRPVAFIIELLPIASSFLPLWILIVYLELKHN